MGSRESKLLALNEGAMPLDEELNAQAPPTETLGLIEVYPGTKPGVTNPDPDIDVVFVHGLGGNSYSTWTKGDTLWIRELLPQSDYFKTARIMSFGYDATAFLQPFANATNGRVFTFAEALLSDLKDKRPTAASWGRPIIFLGHSLGGIVIKSALRHAHERGSMYGDILNSTKAIVFFGTPHQGADPAAWAAYLGKLGRVIGLRSSEVVNELKRWSNPMNELTTVFAELWDLFDITTYFETKDTYNVRVVPEGTARVGQKNEQARGLAANHKEICKFSQDDPNWGIVRRRLDAIVLRLRADMHGM